MASIDLEVKAGAPVPTGNPPRRVAGSADPTDGGLNVHIVGGSVTGGAPLVTTTVSAAPASNLVVKASPGTFFSAACDIDPTAPTATYYVLLIDAAALPVNGAVTLLAAIAVDHVLGARDSVSLTADAGGYACAAGIVVALSSTRPALTISGAFLWVNGGKQ
jgi:hypothetical protein